ncbi:cell division protein FtsZ [Fodinicurvata sediminis]|uniref:cell division protein FtsZ n=1 Tax=Fodinicurvata sediminis TaxID=1121832 RepID=UPI0003B33D97|nr:cell division protein FtsZ [Fodinicurvata sediminis]
MSLNLSVPETQEVLRPRITVIGVGGAGGNAVNNMIRSNLEGVEFVIANTDSQAMQQSLCEERIQLGRNITSGLGAGSRPDVGRAAAEEALEEVLTHLDGANMVFITAGMGGGTGTGAAPVIARAAREAGLLTVGVVTKPFQFEGIHRMRMAEQGIQELSQYVDTLIIIPNQNLFRIATEKTTFADAFKMADDVLYSGVRGVTDLMVMPGLINLDFADIRAVMTEMGKAMMGTGEAEGDNRAIAAAEAAISNPLLDDVSMCGARGVLINITGGEDMTLFEADEAANRIRDEVDPEANIIFGSTFDESLNGRMRVSVVSTGIEMEAATQPRPGNLSLVSGQGKPAGETAARSSAAQGGPAASARPAAAGVATAAATATATAMAHDELADQEAQLQASAATEMQQEDWQAAPEAESESQEDELLLSREQAVADEAHGVASGDEQVAAARVEEDMAPSAEDSFSMPEPMRPRTRRLPEAAPGQQAGAYEAAEMANASKQGSPGVQGRTTGDEQGEPPMRNRAYSLLDRITGGGKGRKSRGEEENQSRGNAPAQPRVEPSLERGPSRPAAEDNTAQQPTFSGMEPKEHASSSSKEDEELLDIPAFLRRQAN